MATTSVHYDCLTGIKTVIEGLGLTGITGGTPLPADRVYLKKLPTDRDLTLPFVVVSLSPQAETEERGTNIEDDWGYPCLVTIVVANNQTLTLVEAELAWRQQIRTAFHNKRPSALATALGSSVPLKICRVEPGPVIDMGLFRDQNLFVSALLIRVITREVR